MTTSYMQARSRPGCRRDSLYGRDWETLEGTDTFTMDEARTTQRDWDREERSFYGRSCTEYRYVNEQGVIHTL